MKRIHLPAAASLWLILLLVSACALAAEVRPTEINPEDYDLNYGSYLLKLKDLDRIAEEGWFTAALYVSQTYEAGQIEALNSGDTVWVRGEPYTVDENLPDETYPDGTCSYEVRMDNGWSVVFRPDRDGEYAVEIDDWHIVVPVGEVRIILPLPENFQYVAYADGEDNLPAGAQEFLLHAAIWGYDFVPYNTRCSMKDGELVYVINYPYPYGPEEEYFVDPEPAANGGFDWERTDEEDTEPFYICGLYGIEWIDNKVLKDAAVTCFRKKTDGSLVPDSRGEYMAGYLRGIAMYGGVAGKVKDPPDPGETLVCVFTGAEGTVLMTMELWNGYVVAGDGLYLYYP